MKGNELPDGADYPDEEYRYFLFAHKFGLTPDQVDEQPAVLLDYLASIANVVDELKAEAYES